MANSKRKCKHCKEYFPADSMIEVPAGRFCSEEHMFEFIRLNNEKARAKVIQHNNQQANKKVKIEKKKAARRKREFYDNDLKTRKKAAKEACHKYIRERDKNNKCICCHRSLGPKYDAGHYLESGNNPRIRYDEDNIHAQNVYCNQYQGGNSDDYRGNLIAKIGIDKVEKLESMKGGTVKRTCDDYKQIELYYKAKLKQLIGDIKT